MHLNGTRSHLAPDFFDPQEIWSPRNVVPRNLGTEKFGPRMKIIVWHFHTGTKFLWAQISQGPNLSGTKFHGMKKVRDPREIGDHFNYL